MFTATHGFAQTPDLPASADPSRLQERLLPPAQPAQDQIIAPPETVIDGNIPDAENGFELKGIILEGVSVFRPDYFDTLIEEYIGRTVDIAVLNHLASRITQIYRNEGYFLSRALIPQQEIQNGYVIIQIIEGQVGSVIIDDQDNLLAQDQLSIVSRTVTKIQYLKPLHGPTLERYILLLNDYSNITIKSVLQAPTEPAPPGSVNIILQALKKPHQNYFASYNNHGSRFVGPHQINAGYSKGGVFNTFDQINLQIASALPASEVKLGSLQYSLPLLENGLTASLSASYSHSHPGLYLKDLDVEGRSAAFSAALSYPLIRSRRQNLYLGTSFSALNSATEFLNEELIDDKLRSISLFANYNTQDSWNGLTGIDISFSKGLNVFGATETGTNNLSRLQGRSDFAKAELDMSRRQALGQSFYVINSLSAQYAPHPLLSAEEFGYGGINFGRAYDPSEITGDQGISTAIEVLYTNIDTIPDLNLKLVPFGFYDIGKVWNEDNGAKPISAASAGFGTYFDFNQRVSGSLQLAYPLTKSVSTPVMNGENGPRILFSLNTSF